MTTWTRELARTTLYPLLQRHRYPGARAHWRRLQALEFAGAAVLARHGLEQRTRLLRHAAAHVPYYRDLCGDLSAAGSGDGAIGSVDTWRSLPILSKTILAAQPKRFLADTHVAYRLLANATGGSTGTPVHFFQDQSYWDQARAAQRLMESWWNIRPGDTTAALWGADRDMADLGWKHRLAGRIEQRRACNVFKLDPNRLETFAGELQAWQPRLLMGYASALRLFAEYVQHHPRLRIRPIAVKSSAEVLTPETRAAIEAAFRAPVFDFYGSREVNNLAAECGAHRGLHANMLTRYIEIVDGHGRAVPPGVPGRILVTDLSNYAMPFIRYENEDIGAWSGRPCVCGRSLPLLGRIWGRQSDFLTTTNGSLIHGEYFTHWFYELPQVRTFQIIQSAPDRVDMEVVTAEGTSAAATRELLHVLERRLQETLGVGMRCEARAVPAIERAASGKHRFTVSTLNQHWTAARPPFAGVAPVGHNTPAARPEENPDAAA